MRRAKFVILCLLSSLAVARAQSTASLPASEAPLAELVERYLAEASEPEARRLKKSIVALRPKVDELLNVLSAKPPVFGTVFELSVPFEGRAVKIRVECPKGHDVSSEPLPVVVQFRLRRIPDTVRVPGVINAWPLNFDPKLKSDELRDAAEKFAHSVAWRANGDCGRLWISGFSTAGHAAFDVALRRPQAFRGIIPMAGAPRRNDFRLLENLRGLSVFAMCGTKDDRELIWNLQELDRRRRAFGFDYFLGLDNRVDGRFIPSPQHVPKIGPHVLSTKVQPEKSSGMIAADDRGIRSSRFEVLAVARSAVKVPSRIPVPSDLGPDEARRGVIDATIGKRAELNWELRREENRDLELRLRSRFVSRVKVFWRRSWLGSAEGLRIVSGKRGRVRTLSLRPKIGLMLDDVRHTGRRSDPCLMEILVLL